MDWPMNGALESSADAMSGQVSVTELLFPGSKAGSQGLSSSDLSSAPDTEQNSFSCEAAIHSTANEQFAAAPRITATWPETAAPDLFQDAPRNHPRHDGDGPRLQHYRGQPGTGPRLRLASAQCQDTSTTAPPPLHQVIDESTVMTRQTRSQADAEGSTPNHQTTSGADTSPASTKSSASRTTQPDASLPANPPSSPSPIPWSDHTSQTHTSTHHARKSQSRVGKRYRDKLGAEFESLQAALRLDDDESREDGLNGQGQLEPPAGQQGKARKRRRPVNKTKVMDLARERISLLLRDWEAVKAEAEALQRQRVVEGW